MGLAVGLQMDPIETIDINGDSTFALGLEAERRGHSLFHYLPGDLSWQQGHVTAIGRPISLRREKGNHVSAGSPEKRDLADLNTILMRQDPPFDLGYISATHILEHIHPKTLVVNDPASVRDAPEKLFVTHFADLMPPTLITRRKDEVAAFRAEHKDIIVKPLYGNGGAGVFRLQPGDENLGALIELFTGIYREPIMVQRYIPQVRQGDKRIILVDGEVAGALNRVPALGEARSNLHVGGRAEIAVLSRRDQEICDRLGPELKKRGLIFVGIDVIGDWLTEINVTSPTGIQEIDRFDDANIAGLVWDAIESRL
ncbi:glutathione synthetase [Iodidimonas nitroreducens]|uniref:Glutathione synthetase n=1 Tax=Iodidimonas nitroreducens TaxID=1236968 RepID=A0A5A7N507_9PROT|nr:glutathione synthase [Iodidimonas nitroreducens]GAK34801.1 glutathione synthetase [alpha proteobacterium Q-1]GER02480.1 glutathione synthetase [Iodidimonas nitroreducens]